jgi:hypothetical protein
MSMRDKEEYPRVPNPYVLLNSASHSWYLAIVSAATEGLVFAMAPRKSSIITYRRYHT